MTFCLWQCFLAALAALYSAMYYSLPTDWVSEWVSATLEFGHIEWVLTLQTLRHLVRVLCPNQKTNDKKAQRLKRQGTKGQKESFILWCQGSYALLRCFLRAMFLCLNLCEGCVWGGHLHDKIWQIVLGDYMYDRSVPEYFSLVVDIGWTCQWPLHPSPVARHPEPMIH